MKKRLFVMMAVLAMTVTSLAGCGGSSNAAVDIPKLEDNEKIKTDKKTFEFDSEGYAKIAANGKYELSIDKKYNNVRVKQVSTGEVWSTAIEGATAEADKALFKVSYFNASAKEASPAQRYSTKMNVGTTYAIKDDSGNTIGIRAEYKDKDLSIGVAMDIYLTDNGLEIKLPMGSVTEEGDYKVISMDICQNLTAAKNTEEGYYMYPDGCGAIMEFQDASHQNENAVEYKIYGDVQQYKNMLGEWDEDGDEVFLPIFGAKIGNKSFLSIIKDGEETASINIIPKPEEGTNKMYCTFTYRNLFNDVRKDKDGNEVTKNRYDSDMADIRRVVSYNFFEAGEDITYADMAVKYREYLTEECGIKKKTDDINIPVSMDIFMGINEEGTIRDSFKAVTTFEEAEKMVDELKKKEIGNLEVQLKGWTDKGYFTDPVQFPANSDIGGNKGLKSFADKYKSDGGVKVSLETNLLEAKAEEGGYDSNTEIVIAGNYNPITDAEATTYLLSPNVAAGKLNQLLEDIKDSKAAIDGISFYSLGQYVTWNYSNDNMINKSQCKKIWEDMLEKTAKEYDEVTVQGGNQYILKYANKATDIPYEDSGYRMSTKSVPVFQIAVHGLVNYTGGALNLSSDQDKEKLKWAEFGYVPFFELTYSGSEELMHTDYSELFSSTFSSWVDEATEVYKDFNKNLIDVWNEFIVDHEEVQEDVFKVTYENGKVVYVNYNDVECEVDGNVIDKNSYLVK